MSNEQAEKAIAVRPAIAPPAIPINRFAYEASSWEEAIKVGNFLFKSGLLPTSIKSEAAAVTIMILGRELGLTAMQSLRGIHVIEGRPTMSSNLMLALIEQSGKQVGFKIAKWDQTICEVRTQKVGREAESISYSIDEAKAAGLTTKNNWKNDTKAMLFNRAISRMARAIYPEVTLGLPSPDEVGETYDTVATEVASPPPAMPEPRGAGGLKAHLAAQVAAKGEMSAESKRVVEGAAAAIAAYAEKQGAGVLAEAREPGGDG